jgi:transcriptional regulator with XRE-family HTH domain
VARSRTNEPFVEEVSRLLEERGLSIRALAREVGVTDAHLSRVLRQVNYKTPSADLAGRVAEAFGLPRDFFPEYREGYVIEKLKANGRLRDELYDRLKRQR